MDVDFLRFIPKKNIELFGYDNFVVFMEKPDKVENFLKGFLIQPESIAELTMKLKKAKKEWIVGISSTDPKINREAVMRKRVDVLLDSANRKLDYVTIRTAAEKDVVIEVCVSKFLRVKGLKRIRIFEETLDVLRIIKKFDAPFVPTSGATNFFEMRPKKQIYEFFSFIGADIEKAKAFMHRLIRRFTDPSYIMNGFEIELG
jgi:ribonuclease P/MRP protein subunit RPP1